MSIKMLDNLIVENGLWEYFENEGLDQNDLTFIKEIILGHPLIGNQQLIGRTANKFFLYQVRLVSLFITRITDYA